MKIIKDAHEPLHPAHGIALGQYEKVIKENQRLRQAVLGEREACAKVVEKYCGAWDDEGYALAQAIRNRGLSNE